MAEHRAVRDRRALRSGIGLVALGIALLGAAGLVFLACKG
jgi:hypothetical protein